MLVSCRSGADCSCKKLQFGTGVDVALGVALGSRPLRGGAVPNGELDSLLDPMANGSSARAR